MGKPILCLDFDGVIHSYMTGWKGADVISDQPVPGAIKFIQDALEFFEVHIFSSRSNQVGGIPAMCKWLREHAGCTDWPPKSKHWTDAVHFPTAKPAAFLTIDDRAICFQGNFDVLSPKELLDFKPWNKT